MSRKTGRNKRVQLFDRGNTACPVCLTGFTRDQASAGRRVTLEHVPPRALGGQARCLACRPCNADAGRSIDQAAALANRSRFPVTVDVMGKRDTFMLSREGKPLTTPFRGYSRQDWEKLDNSPSRKFTMGIRIPNRAGVAASAVKAAYLALFSLLGARAGYEYVRGNALAPVRRLIVDPPDHDAIRKYVCKALDKTPDSDILLVSQPFPFWIVKIEKQLVTLPLAGDGPESAPLWQWSRQTGSDRVFVTGLASWPFQTFGALRSVYVHLSGADRVKSLLGLVVRGEPPNGERMEGTCISHTGESAILLCPGAMP